MTGNGSVWTNTGVVNAGGPGSSNLLTIANGGLVVAPALNIGTTGSNNTVARDRCRGHLCKSLVTSSLGSNTNSLGNQLIVNDGAILSSSNLTVGSVRSGFYSLTFCNAIVTSSAVAFGTGSSNNTGTVQANTETGIWAARSSPSAVRRLLETVSRIDSSVLTNVGLIAVGGGQAGSPVTNALGQ